MWNYNRTPNQGCNAHRFINFSCSKAKFLAFSKVVFYTIIATKYEGTRKSDKLFTFYVQMSLAYAFVSRLKIRFTIKPSEAMIFSFILLR